jgi:hypothetical protein
MKGTYTLFLHPSPHFGVNNYFDGYGYGRYGLVKMLNRDELYHNSRRWVRRYGYGTGTVRYGTVRYGYGTILRGNVLILVKNFDGKVSDP